MGVVRGPVRSGQWQVRAAEVSEGRESGIGAREEGMASNSALDGSGWRGVEEGTGSKCGEVVEWTGGESKGAEQPLLQPSRWTLGVQRWTLAQGPSNVGRCLC